MGYSRKKGESRTWYVQRYWRKSMWNSRGQVEKKCSRKTMYDYVEFPWVLVFDIGISNGCLTILQIRGFKTCSIEEKSIWKYQRSINFQVNFQVYSRKTHEISMGLGFWTWNFQGLSQFCRISSGESLFSWEFLRVNLKFVGGIFRNVYLQLSNNVLNPMGYSRKNKPGRGTWNFQGYWKK